MSIQVEDLSKSFGSIEVLKGIDFEFEAGAVNMIIGASGSGKTVMLKCIVGLLQPDKGRILYDNQDLHSLSVKQLRVFRKQMGMLFQSSALFDSQTIFENVAFPMRMFTNSTNKQITARVIECLERVNLNGAEKKFPSELSGGMKKRAALARAIVLNPNYLFCDEPNSGLDPTTGAIIDELIAELTKDFNTTTLVISHDIKSVLSIGDKILYLYKGKKEWQGSRNELLTSNNEQLNKYLKTSGFLNK